MTLLRVSVTKTCYSWHYNLAVVQQLSIYMSFLHNIWYIMSLWLWRSFVKPEKISNISWVYIVFWTVTNWNMEFWGCWGLSGNQSALLPNIRTSNMAAKGCITSPKTLSSAVTSSFQAAAITYSRETLKKIKMLKSSIMEQQSLWVLKVTFQAMLPFVCHYREKLW